MEIATKWIVFGILVIVGGVVFCAISQLKLRRVSKRIRDIVAVATSKSGTKSGEAKTYVRVDVLGGMAFLGYLLRGLLTGRGEFETFYQTCPDPRIKPQAAEVLSGLKGKRVDIRLTPPFASLSGKLISVYNDEIARGVEIDVGMGFPIAVAFAFEAVEMVVVYG